MNMPKPGPEHAVLGRLAGSWIGEEVMHPSPWSPVLSKATGRIEAKMGVDDFFLITDYQQEVDGKVTFRGHGVYGYDAGEKKFTMHWFDSMGMDPGAPALGELEGDVLTFKSRSPMGEHRYVHEFGSEDGYSFRMDVSTDGIAWRPLMEGTYRRA